jgi:vacuole morphology and inheritance protein 14
LYEAFSHNAVATISLCLLCELYEHATALLCIVGGYEMSVDFLCELDKLVQLIESPVFAPMRLQLLEPRKYPYLFQALFALLMILPQSTAFGTLQRRLSCVNSGQVLDLATFATTASVLSKKAEAGGSGTSVLDFTELQGRFLAIQEKQMRYRDDLRLAKNREIVADQARAGRKLIDAIKKKSTIL